MSTRRCVRWSSLLSYLWQLRRCAVTSDTSELTALTGKSSGDTSRSLRFQSFGSARTST